MKATYDVAVVGAGPAGSSAAYFLAKLGLDVCLLEAKNLPRDKVCGDGIGPRAVLMLQELGLADWLESNCFRIDRLRVVSHRGTAVVGTAAATDFPVTHGYVVSRTIFDQKLVDQARAAGAQLFTGFTVSGAIQDNSRVDGIRGVYDERPAEVRARLTVAADGSRGALSRTFGAGVFSSQAVGVRVYADGVQGVDGCANIFFLDTLPKGYGWIFPSSPSAANVGVGTLGLSKHSELKIREALAEFVERRDLSPLSMAGARIVGPAAGWVMRMNFGRRPVSRPGLAFVGDAAGLVSPINGEGISHALESSRMLAEVLDGRWKADRDLDAALRGYGRAMNRRFLSYFRWGRFLDRVLSKPERLDRLIRQAQKNQELAQVLLGVLSNTIHPRELGRLRILRHLV